MPAVQPVTEGSIPSIVAAAASTAPMASDRPPSTRPSQPAPRSQPPRNPALQTPYPMMSPFPQSPAGGAPAAAPSTPPEARPIDVLRAQVDAIAQGEVVIKPVPIPAAAMSSEPIFPPPVASPAPVSQPLRKAPTLGNLDATVREALDMLDREDFEASGIDIAVQEDEPTAPRLPAVQAPADRSPSSEEPINDELEVEEVQPPTTKVPKTGPAAAPPPRKTTITTGKSPVISEAMAAAPASGPPPASTPTATATATLPAATASVSIVERVPETAPAGTLPSAKVTVGLGTEATPSPPIVAAAASQPDPALAARQAAPTFDGTGEVRKKKKQWYEELFNDDFQRTMPRVPPSFLDREVGFIEDSLGCEKGATILDLGCGPGEHAVRLAKRGYEVIGIDLSLSMLARAADEATELQQRINFVQGDMRDLAFEDAFDGVFCWGTTFGYFDEAKNIEVIQKVHRALRRGGRLLLDIVNRDYVISRSPSMNWFEGDGCVCMDEMTVNAITSRLQVKRTMMMEDGRQREIDYSIRLYALHELGKMLHDSGFRVAEASGDTSTPGVYFGAESPRILILAEKR
jgi:SAM-dependent methyltransferase